MQSGYRDKIKGYSTKFSCRNLYLHHNDLHIKKENVKIMKINIRKNVQFVDLKEMKLIIIQKKCIK